VLNRLSTRWWSGQSHRQFSSDSSHPLICCGDDIKQTSNEGQGLIAINPDGSTIDTFGEDDAKQSLVAGLRDFTDVSEKDSHIVKFTVGKCCRCFGRTGFCWVNGGLLVCDPNLYPYFQFPKETGGKQRVRLDNRTVSCATCSHEQIADRRNG
jgi:hypothetical protein